MLEVLNLQHYPADVLYFAIIAILIVGAAAGYLADSIMGNRGFGPAGNGILITFSALMGIYIRNAYLGMMQPGDLAFTGFLAAASATLILLLLGLAKKWVQE